MFADLDFPSFKTLLFGAEAIGEKLFNRLKQQPYRLMNVYGPTENTVLSTIRIVGKDTSYDDIGYPLKGTVCYVLSENLQQTTLGATGELCLGGPQVSLGYIGSVQLNENHSSRTMENGCTGQVTWYGSNRTVQYGLSGERYSGQNTWLSYRID